MSDLDAYIDGLRAADNGKAIESNPFPPDSKDAMDFAAGWHESRYRTALDRLADAHKACKERAHGS